jgi:hypothetical protein
MSSPIVRGLLCLSAAFALLAGVAIWVQLMPAQRIVASPRKIPNVQPTPAMNGGIQQPGAKNARRNRNDPNVGVPMLEQPPINDGPPRFFQRGFKGGFAKKSRANLSERLGVRIEKPSEDTLQQLGLAESDGIVLEDVRVGSVAEVAGLKIGDILLTLDGQNVPSDPEQFHFQLDNLKTNDPFDAVLLRDGRMETIKGIVLPEASPRFFPRRQVGN